jgi:hypothetical protein
MPSDWSGVVSYSPSQIGHSWLGKITVILSRITPQGSGRHENREGQHDLCPSGSRQRSSSLANANGNLTAIPISKRLRSDAAGKLQLGTRIRFLGWYLHELGTLLFARPFHDGKVISHAPGAGTGEPPSG